MATEIDIAVTTTTYDVTITASPNEYIVNITTNAGGGIESVTGLTVDNTDPLNPVVNVPTLQEITDNESGLSVTDGVIQATALVATNGVQGEEVAAIYGDDSVILRPQGLSVDFQRGANQGQLNANGIDGNYTWELPNADGTIALTSDIPTIPTAAIERGVFSGEFALSNAVRGGEYTPLTQTGALTLSIGASAVNGGIDTVLLTANGSAISGFSTWKKLSSDSISTTAATVMFIMVRQYQGVIYYTVNIIT